MTKKIIKLPKPPSEEERWHAIVRTAADKLREAIKLLQANRESTTYSMIAAERHLRVSRVGLLQIKPKKRMTREQYLNSRKKAAATVLKRLLSNVEAGLYNESVFAGILLNAAKQNGIKTGFLWPSEISLLADAKERKVISEGCYQRIMAMNDGKFVGKVPAYSNANLVLVQTAA